VDGTLPILLHGRRHYAQRLANGIENDVATLSTLTAANNEPQGGASKATILILSAQTPDLPAYVAFWLEQLQVAPTDTVSNLVPQATRTYRRFDTASGLWKEVVALKIPSGSMIVAYIGLDGTYQVNRPHFSRCSQIAPSAVHDTARPNKHLKHGARHLW